MFSEMLRAFEQALILYLPQSGCQCFLVTTGLRKCIIEQFVVKRVQHTFCHNVENGGIRKCGEKEISLDLVVRRKNLQLLLLLLPISLTLTEKYNSSESRESHGSTAVSRRKVS